MTAKEMREFKHVLEHEQEVAARAASRRRQSIAIEQSAETFEQIGYAGERELAMADLSRHSDLIRQIQAALRRIEKGTFGICQACRKPIPMKRLVAVPWTARCVRCQQAADAQDSRIPDSVDQTRTAAA